MTATLTSFPLYVPIASDGAGAGMGSKTRDDGYDIRFTSSDGSTTLPYERESYSEASSNVTGNFWVGATLNADNDANTDDTIYLYYGNTGAADGQNRTSVWDSNYKGVWHLSGSTLSTLDSTGNANNGTNNGATTTTGKIGSAGSFDGATDYISIPDSASWDFSTGAFSVSMWFKKTSEARGDIFNKKSSDSNDDVGLLLEDDETMDVYFKIDTVGDVVVSNGHVFSLNAWHYATMVRDGSSNLTTYIDGSPDGTGTSGGNMNNNSADIWIGSNHDDFMAPSLAHTGLIDEIRISNVARSAAWTSFEYNNMNATGNKLTFAAEEKATAGWLYRKAITIDHTNVDAALTNFPLLVRVSQDTDLGAEAQSDGEDIRFTSNDGETILPYERESYSVSSGSGSGNFWVKVPTISNTADTTIYLYYGNSAAADGQDAVNVWDSNFKGVWHLAETGTNPTAYDSTSNNNDSATQTWTPTTNGKISGAGSFNGSSNAINITSNDGLNPAVITVTAWAQADVNNKWQYVALKDGQWDFGRDNDGKYYLAAWKTGPTNVTDAHAATSATTGVWEYIAFTYNGSSAKYYVNTTVVINDDVNGNLYTSTNAVNIGSQAAGNYWDGLIDDVKISNVVRATEWIKFEYYNTGAVDNELAWSAEQDAVTGKSATTTSLASSDTSSGYGQSVTLTATVSPSSATGTVLFKNGATTLGSTTLGHGSGSIAVTDLAVGSHNLTAEYGGNASYLTSTSSAVTQTVSKATSSVALASSDTTTAFSDSVTLTATVTPSTATGTITFKNGATTLGSTTLGHGSGSIAVTDLAVGSHSLTAEYGGNENYDTSTSSTVTQTVSKATSSVILASSDTSTTYGDSVTLTATMTPAAATGTITFKNGATTLGTATLGNGSGSLTISTLASGTHSLTAEYGGNENYATATSSALTQTVSAQSTTATTSPSASNGATSGSHRGSNTAVMAGRIESARLALLSRFSEKQKQSQKIAAEDTSNIQKQQKEEEDAVAAAATLEAHIAERIAVRKAEVTRIEEAKKDAEAKYALHREVRLARAVAQEEKNLAEAQAALLAEQQALKTEQEANAQKRAERLARQDQWKAEGELKAAAPSLEVLAARRDRLYSVIGDTPVLYADVPLSAWYAPFVSLVVEENIATGYADETGKPKGEFGVTNPVTFAEVLKMALNAAGKDADSLPPPRNTSAQGTWASSFVAEAEALALSVFAPSLDVHTPASRGAVVQTILEVMGIPTGIKIDAPFTDVPSNHPYAQAIATAAAYGLISGDTDAQGNALHTFRPDEPIVRAEVAKIIALVKEVLGH
jgi:hypothetical protein